MGGLKESGPRSFTSPMRSAFGTCHEELEENPGQNLLGGIPEETAQDRTPLDQRTKASCCETGTELGIEELPVKLGTWRRIKVKVATGIHAGSKALYSS